MLSTLRFSAIRSQNDLQECTLRFRIICTILVLVALSAASLAQVEISGRVWMPKPDGSGNIPFTAIFAFGSTDQPASQALSMRSWETEPAGWYYLTGPAGRYTLLYSTPGKAMRPVIITNVYTTPGAKFDINAVPQFDYAVVDESQWDPKPASEYCQTFTAKGNSVTSVGFKLAHDGVDGEGPGSQTLMVSIHKKGPGTPETWPQVGPAVPVLDVDCGGVKGYSYSAGWNSGEVPTVPGETYAVRLRPELPSGKVQAYWRDAGGASGGCYRIGEGNTGWQGRDLWMVIGSDSDGLLIPYNKRVHREYVGETRFARKWTQTYLAKGRSLAGVILYAATSGVQPGIPRQRVIVRVRKGGPDGPVVGVEKLAIGDGNFTGDASWGVFGVTYAPGEVPLEPGHGYAIEFESAESMETLHGYVNIKGMPSDDKPGFHPYPKVAPDDYPHGLAYINGNQATDFDLDMQIIEYQANPQDWANALDEPNLVRNGEMSAGTLGSDTDTGRPAFWRPFAIDKSTVCQYVTDLNETDNRILRVIGGGATQKTADGGWVQQVRELSSADTYRLSGKVRCTWPADARHQCFVGYDPTGQTDDPKAPTIVWTTALPQAAGLWMTVEHGPIRPTADSISIWVSGKTDLTSDFPFRADFDDFTMHRVKTEVPR